MPANPVLLRAEGLVYGFPGRVVLERLDLTVGPGLGWVRGGDGRGKTSLLGLLSGRLQAQAGRVVAAGSVSWPDATLTDHDELPGERWLQQRRAADDAWNARLQADLVEAFAIAPHLPKPLFQWSAGSRRKLGLVAAFAGGASVTLLDTPYAALDMASCRVLTELLREAAAHPSRAWVVADAEVPAALQGVPMSAWVDLGD